MTSQLKLLQLTKQMVIIKTTYYLGDFIQIRITNGTQFNETYFYHNNQLVAKKDNDNQLTFYHPDHLGSTSLVTNSIGVIVEEEFYLPFGSVLEGSEESRYLHAGQEKDQITGLYLRGIRYYDSNLRHFIQADPLVPNLFDPKNLNHYSYVKNNPYVYVDLTGQEPTLPQIGSYETFYQQLRDFEATQNSGQTASQTLNNLVSFQGTFNSQLGERQAFLYSSEARYTYTSEAGFVDNLHLITAAAQTQKSGALATTFGGIYVELRQILVDPSSAFSYDDLRSNKLGVEFAGQLNDKDSLSAQYISFIESIGGSTTPIASLENQYPGLSQNIPETDPSDSPSYTSYSSGGKALPKESLLNRVSNFFSGS